MRHIDEIIVHCTATQPNFMPGHSTARRVEEVRKWHTSPPRKWSDIGYHYLIDRDGTIAPGRPVARAGAHVAGHNKTAIGVALFGGHGSAASDRFEDNFTPEQNDALRALIEKLKAEHPGIKKISGHNQYANKACPGFDVSRWLARKAPRTSVSQSSTMKASAASLAGAAGTAVSAVAALDSTAQYIVLGFAGVIALATFWIMRERIKRWARGDR